MFWFGLIGVELVLVWSDWGRVWFGLVMCGLDWLGVVWFGAVWLGAVWVGWVQFGDNLGALLGKCVQARAKSGLHWSHQTT